MKNSVIQGPIFHLLSTFFNFQLLVVVPSVVVAVAVPDWASISFPVIKRTMKFLN